MVKTGKKVIAFILRFSGLPVLIRCLYQKNRITIIYYHEIDPASFEIHIKYLRKHYSIISLDTLSQFLYGNILSLPLRPVLITIDDGHSSNFNLFDSAKLWNISPVIFLTAGMIGSEQPFWFKHPSINDIEKQRLKEVSDDIRRAYIDSLKIVNNNKHKGQALTWSEINKMSALFDFQSHTLSHPCLPNCKIEVLKEELVGSIELLGKSLNKPIIAIAYPNGDFNERVICETKNAGYLLGFTGMPGFIKKGDNPYTLKRFSINDTKDKNEFILRVTGIWAFLKGVSQKTKKYGSCLFN